MERIQKQLLSPYIEAEIRSKFELVTEDDHLCVTIITNTVKEHYFPGVKYDQLVSTKQVKAAIAKAAELYERFIDVEFDDQQDMINQVKSSL